MAPLLSWRVLVGRFHMFMEGDTSEMIGNGEGGVLSGTQIGEEG